MSGIKLDAVFTRAGINSLLANKESGIQQAITHIALGDTAFTPNENMTSLTGEVERFAIADAQEGDLVLRLGVRASTDKEYPVRSVAGFLDDGTMLFAYSSSDASFLLTYLTPHISGLDIRFLLKLDAVPSNALTVTVTDPGTMVFTSEFAKIASAQLNSFLRAQRQTDELTDIKERLRVIDNKINLLGENVWG